MTLAERLKNKGYLHPCLPGHFNKIFICLAESKHIIKILQENVSLQ
ncbi:Uncharacterized protein dnl_09170 [Desulfonema limicola]|uniref:Uncharacterized protein n=1 Tax=Desulfonema limicola TaxID=45656 RepID=A0A975GEY0_9BACT|nr:Uncharacterized protein dnl_09170 [Desulfonema limicola]